MQRTPLMLLDEKWLGKLIISERQRMDSILGGSEIHSELEILNGWFHSSDTSASRRYVSPLFPLFKETIKAS